MNRDADAGWKLLPGHVYIRVARYAAQTDRRHERDPARNRHARTHVSLHGKRRDGRAVRILHAVGDERPAQIGPQRQPARRRHLAVQQVAVTVERRQLIADRVAAVAVDEATAARVVVALVAAHAAGRELPLRVGPGRPFRGGDQPRADEQHRQVTATRHDVGPYSPPAAGVGVTPSQHAARGTLQALPGWLAEFSRYLPVCNRSVTALVYAPAECQ